MPETLHALVAARLDGLDAEERRLLGDAAVLGKTFARGSLAAITDADPAVLDVALASLVRKEVLGLQSDPRSPEHGQYGFLQDLLRQVAYETLPKTRTTRQAPGGRSASGHRHGRRGGRRGGGAHLLEAYQLEPDASDAGPLRERAQAALCQAGERAASLGAAVEAERYFEQAGRLGGEPAVQAGAFARAGEMAVAAGAVERGGALFAEASALYESSGDTHAAARVASWLGFTELLGGRIENAIEWMERAYATVEGDEPDAEVGLLVSRLGQSHYFAGQMEQAAEWAELALDIGEALQLTDVLIRGWTTKSGIIAPSRPEEARSLLQARSTGLSCTTICRSRTPATATSRIAACSATATPTPSQCSRNLWPWHAGSVTGVTSGSRSPR